MPQPKKYMLSAMTAEHDQLLYAFFFLNVEI